MNKKQKTQRLPDIYYNPVSLFGTALALISFGLILFLYVLDSMTSESKPYMGIIAFVILPIFLILGLILIAIGMLRERKRKLEGNYERHFPVIDLNSPSQRTAVTFFSVGTLLLLIFSAFGSFKAYEYTDSDAFCGQVCHKVMEPEFTAYQNSPHSKVGCVKCHIGPGADWFVRSKISGAYQVYSVLFNKYSRPIPTPIENLRPAQETCEQCHWPKHFYSEKKVNYTYYLSDEKNTKSNVTLLMKIGGGNSELGTTEGIHWHMNIANTIYYYPDDHTRQNIPWIKMISNDGKEVIYKSKDFDSKNFEQNKIRKMDCLDCHNRPSHIYNQPDKMMNIYMSNGKIDESIPYIKSIGVQVLENSYSTKEIALDSIKIFVDDFYATYYPDVYKDKKIEIENSIKEIQNIYDRNYFPEMNVSWRKFPNNLGHTYAKGCYRCHDGEHFSDDGKKISNDCNICHLVIQQSINGLVKVDLNGLTFNHPIDISGAEHYELCSDCHLAKK